MTLFSIANRWDTSINTTRLQDSQDSSSSSVIHILGTDPICRRKPRVARAQQQEATDFPWPKIRPRLFLGFFGVFDYLSRLSTGLGFPKTCRNTYVGKLQWNSTPFLTAPTLDLTARPLQEGCRGPGRYWYCVWWLVVGLYWNQNSLKYGNFRWIWRVKTQKSWNHNPDFFCCWNARNLIQLLWPGSNDGWLQDIQTRPVLLASTRDSNIRHSPMSCGREDHRRADVSLCEGGPCYWNHDGMSITL